VDHSNRRISVGAAFVCGVTGLNDYSAGVDFEFTDQQIAKGLGATNRQTGILGIMIFAEPGTISSAGDYGETQRIFIQGVGQGAQLWMIGLENSRIHVAPDTEGETGYYDLLRLSFDDKSNYKNDRNYN
jgi:hypothetical protein